MPLPRPAAPSLALAAAVLIGALAGCGANDAVPPPNAETAGLDPALARDTTLTDDLGRAVTFRVPADRVFALAPSLTEIAYAVGAGDRLAAASPSDTYPEAATRLPQVATFPLDLERVVALRPGLLLATDQVNRTEDADQLARLGVPTVFFSFDAVADVARAMDRVAALLGGDPAAADAFRRRVDAVAQATAARRAAGVRAPRVLLLVGDDTPYAFGRDSYASEMVRLAGGENLTDTFAGATALPADEFVLEAAPEVIVVLAGDAYDPARLVARHPTWRALPAVRDGRVVGLDPDLVSRPGPRVADGLERLARLLHPAPSAAAP